MTFVDESVISKCMFFLVFEGLDGSGKSSLMKRLDSYLLNLENQTLVTREPGGTNLGDQLRRLILEKNNGSAPTPKTELLMYQASRAQHVDLIIRPALEAKKWVLCDRFSASSIAFQGGGRGISVEQVEWLNSFSTENLIPDLTVLLDLSVEESKKRRQNRSNETGESDDRIESEADTFHERVRLAFLKQAKKSPQNWLVLNAALTPEELFQTLIDELKRKKWLV
jgi:dTMP kinase